MKINRRDYLKRMGAAGVLAGVTGLEGFAHEPGHPLETCPTEEMCTRPRAPRIWQPGWCKDFPANPKYVKLIFYGLLGIAPRVDSGKVQCHVGFHSKGDDPIHHQLSIRAYSNVVDASSCSSNKKFEQKTRIENIVLGVTDPDPDVDQAYFYQRGKACARRELADDKDFRWIVDFESDYLYKKHLSANSNLEKKKDVYSPVLTVERGIFYTLHKTGSTFLARSDDCKYFSDLGNVADYIAANIYVKSGGVTVNVDGATFTVQAPGEIYFDNHCMNEDNEEMKCKFEPESTDKKKRSDFFLNYKAFDRKGHPEYHLHLLQYKKPEMLDVICERSKFEKMTDDEKKFSDESPCSAAGYGGETRGFPPYS